MDYSRWSEMQQLPPNPNPSTDPYAQFYNAQPSSYARYPYYPTHQSQNPNLSTNPQTAPRYHEIPPAQFEAGPDAVLRPPGIDTYAAMNSYHHSHLGFEAQAAVAYAHQHTQIGGLAAATYYQDPNVVTQTWAAKEVIRQYGADPVGYAAAGIRPPKGTEPLVPANPNPIFWTNPVFRPPINGAMRRGPKKTKIVQSAWCEVCKIDCNSRDVLDQHKLGKKHKKNLEKLEESKKNALAPTPVAKTIVIGPQENPSGDNGRTVGVQQSRKKAAPSLAPGEDLETKRRKLMEGGAAEDAVRVCAICNVVCNSETVLNFHLAGQKHAAMVKKQEAGTADPGT